MVRLAANDCVFMLDDDAYVIDATAVRQAVDVFRRTSALSEPWRAPRPKPTARPGPRGCSLLRVAYVCYVAAYIGFAHLLRRSVFLNLGGYQESFRFYGEEKDYCLRLLDAGYDVVYLPDARVAHVPDPVGSKRDALSALRRSQRLFERALQRAAADAAPVGSGAPASLSGDAAARPRRRSRRSALDRRRAREGRCPVSGADRKPMRWASIRRWRRLSRDCPRFVSSAAPSV